MRRRMILFLDILQTAKIKTTCQFTLQHSSKSYPFFHFVVKEISFFVNSDVGYNIGARKLTVWVVKRLLHPLD